MVKKEKVAVKKGARLFVRITEENKAFLDKKAELESGANLSEFMNRLVDKLRTKYAGKTKRVL